MSFGNQSRSSSLIINIFDIANLDPKLKTWTWSQNCNMLDYYEIWGSEQIENAHY